MDNGESVFVLKPQDEALGGMAILAGVGEEGGHVGEGRCGG